MHGPLVGVLRVVRRVDSISALGQKALSCTPMCSTEGAGFCDGVLCPRLCLALEQTLTKQLDVP